MQARPAHTARRLIIPRAIACCLITYPPNAAPATHTVE